MVPMCLICQRVQSCVEHEVVLMGAVAEDLTTPLDLHFQGGRGRSEYCMWILCWHGWQSDEWPAW